MGSFESSDVVALLVKLDASIVSDFLLFNDVRNAFVLEREVGKVIADRS